MTRKFISTELRCTRKVPQRVTAFHVTHWRRSPVRITTRQKEPAVSPNNQAATSRIGRRLETPGFVTRLKRAVRGLLFRIGFRPLVCLAQECLHILRSYRVLRSVDMLVIAGGGQLDEEWGGSWAHPYALMKWAVLARAAGTSVVFLSVGGCRAESRFTKLFLRIALSLACYRSYRDEGSRQLALAITPSADGPVVPDLAFSLPVTRQPLHGRFELSRIAGGCEPDRICSSWHVAYRRSRAI